MIVKVVIKYGRESLSLDDVLGALKSKDLKMKFERKIVNEWLQVKAKSEKEKFFKR